MAVTTNNIISGWQKGTFQPAYVLDGEEDFFIDEIVDYAENKILSPEESSFNLTIFYGRDADWATVENACKRYPMFAERQVVIVKEAQYMKDLERLENYLSQPLASTILVIAHKEKKLDKRKSFYKTVQKKAVVFTSEKLKENKVDDWIQQYVKSQGLKISGKAAALLHEHIGDDLSRITHEINKLAINLQSKQTIEDDDIEKYIGISKEYNSFELQAAIFRRDLARAIKIVQYFEHNPKAGGIHGVIPLLYNTFAQVYQAYGLSDQSDNSLMSVFKYYGAMTSARIIMKNYDYEGVEKTILLLHSYNLKSLGVGSAYSNETTLLREMLAKIII